MNTKVRKMLEDFTKIESIESIVLAGSQATGVVDEGSDYDIYIYSKDNVDVNLRESIFRKYDGVFEINNMFWETEDDGYINDDGRKIPVEFIYRNIEWLEGELESVVKRCEARVGYTTCFWHNLINSVIIYDKNRRIGKLKKDYDVSYPAELKENIIKKNLPLIKDSITAYRHQIEKALGRSDVVSINHRVSALLASYFDIVFAINHTKHPGEKKLVEHVKKLEIVPDKFENDVNSLISRSGIVDKTILDVIDSLDENLKRINI